MINNDKIRITRMHISSLEKDENKIYKLNIKKYPDRICVVDYEKEIVIDVETRHQYPYIETKSMIYLTNSVQLKKIQIGQRIGCIEYLIIPSLELNSKILKECEEIISLLKSGYVFLDGNKQLTNEEYLEVIKKTKEMPKTGKIYKKRK